MASITDTILLRINTVVTGGASVGALVTGLGALVGGTLAAGLGLVTLAGKAEQSQVAFTTLLGSAQAAKGFLADLAQFAAQTPFDFVGLQKTSEQLLAALF